MLVKVAECLKNDFRLSRVQNTPRFLVFFERSGENMSSNFNCFSFFQIRFAQCWKSFLGCYRGVGIFSRVHARCF